jgi:CBS domain-containing protein
MTNCPYCDFENIEGSDGCEQCGQPLSDMHLRDPQTSVERGLLRDRIVCLQPKPPIVVAGDTPCSKVLQLMADQHIGCVFVGQADQVEGVFTEKDAVVRLGVNCQQYQDEPISRFMTPGPEGLTADAKIAFAVRQMDLGGYRHLPTLDASGRIVGVISVRDILGYLSARMK